jgi:two-component system, cell cycle response regulator DivK
MNKRKILIIEDDRSVSELLSHILDGHNYEVATAHDGADGLNKVSSFNPELVLLDVNLPVMDGWRVLEAIKTSPKTHKVQVLMCTEHSMIKEIDNALSLGADGYITKPFNVDRVLSKVADTLGPDIPEKNN